MSMNLNELTTKELQVILNMTVARCIEVQAKSDHLRGVCEALEVTYPATDSCKEVEFELETLSLFRVQVLNAIAEVDRKEFINMG